MADIEALLNRWQTAGVLDAGAAARIRAHEQEHARPGGLRWQGITALILGAILLACGVALFVSAHWDELAPGARFALVLAMVAVFHLGGGLVREKYHGLSTALHALGTAATGAAIALTGQIFNIEEHWPAAILMWALAALAGWMLVQDEAQQTLALLLAPAWMLSEISYYAAGHIGENVYLGRALFTWAVLYLTFFVGSQRRAVRGILFAAGAITAISGIALMAEDWVSSSAAQTFSPFGLRVWAWVVIAALPLAIAAFHGHKGLIPPAAAVALSMALPWCSRSWKETYGWGNGHSASFTQTGPNLLAHVLVAGFAVFVCWWGVRLASRMLVNLGIAWFAIAVAWFYFSNVFDKLGRSLGLIGLGILFLAGGWALEKTRRRLVAGMEEKSRLPETAGETP